MEAATLQRMTNTTEVTATRPQTWRDPSQRMRGKVAEQEG